MFAVFFDAEVLRSFEGLVGRVFDREESIVEMGDDVREIMWGEFGDETNTATEPGSATALFRLRCEVNLE